MELLRDHPDIEHAMLTGYPRGGEPEPIHCEECENEIDSEDIYEDESHEVLCEKCLLHLHKKRWWL